MSEIAMLAINTDGGVAVARDVEDDERVAGQARHEHDAALSHQLRRALGTEFGYQKMYIKIVWTC